MMGKADNEPNDYADEIVEEPKTRDVNQELCVAISDNDVSSVERLLETGLDGEKPDLEARDETGWTALHNAAALSSVEIVQLLLEHGADPTKENDQHQTPDKIAYEFRNDECGSLLHNARKEREKGRAPKDDRKNLRQAFPDARERRQQRTPQPRRQGH